MNRRKMTLLAMLLMFSQGMWAQQAKPLLVVWQKSGEKVYYDLADQPETTFEDGLLIIKTKSATVEYQLTNILRYTYEGTGATDISQLATERSVSISKQGDSVVFSNLSDGSVVNLYSANGMLLDEFTAQNGLSLTVSLGQRPAGMYILKCGSETIKLVKP